MNKNNIKSKIYIDAVKQSFKKLSPRVQIKNPVMFVVYIGAILTSALWMLSFAGIRDESAGYTFAIAMILWFTVLFANFAEAIAEGRGRAQAAERGPRRGTVVRTTSAAFSRRAVISAACT